jgi:hypothetical protein
VGKTAQAKWDCPDRVHQIRWFSGQSDRRLDLMRRPKVLKSKLAQGGPLVSSPLRSDGSIDALTVVKALKGVSKNNSR